MDVPNGAVIGVSGKAEQRRLTHRVQCQWVGSALIRKVNATKDKTSSGYATFNDKISSSTADFRIIYYWNIRVPDSFKSSCYSGVGLLESRSFVKPGRILATEPD
ncbi:MAG: hypothetical protein ACK5ME_02755 [Parahaliea sp.]